MHVFCLDWYMKCELVFVREKMFVPSYVFFSLYGGPAADAAQLILSPYPRWHYIVFV